MCFRVFGCTVCFGIPQWWSRWLDDGQRVGLPPSAPDALRTVDGETLTEIFVLGGIKSAVARLRPALAAKLAPALEECLRQLQSDLPAGIEVEFDVERRAPALARTA